MLNAVQVHGVLELVVLGLLGVDIILRLIWLSPRHFFRHRRTMFIVSYTLQGFFTHGGKGNLFPLKSDIYNEMGHQRTALKFKYGFLPQHFVG